MNSTPINSIRPVPSPRGKDVSEMAPRSVAKGSSPPGPVSAQSLDAATSPPIDGERVALIRAAIANGTYPILPAKIADAMIAAGIILRTRK